MELIYYMHNRGVPRDALSPERLQFRDLTLVFGGELRYLIDNREILLRPGDAVYIREGEERARKALENCDYISFNFRPDERETLPELPVYIPDGMTNEIRLLLSACDEIRDRMTEDADRLALILECILRQIAVNLLPPNTCTRRSPCATSARRPSFPPPTARRCSGGRRGCPSWITRSTRR